MPQRPMTPMEKYREGIPLTPSEKYTVQRTLERNRKAKINIGRKRSRGPAGMTLGEMKKKPVKKKPRKIIKKKPSKFKPGDWKRVFKKPGIKRYTTDVLEQREKAKEKRRKEFLKEKRRKEFLKKLRFKTVRPKKMKY